MTTRLAAALVGLLLITGCAMVRAVELAQGVTVLDALAVTSTAAGSVRVAGGVTVDGDITFNGRLRGVGALPQGSLLFWPGLTECPTRWTRHSAVEGRMVVGLQSATVGRHVREPAHERGAPARRDRAQRPELHASDRLVDLHEPEPSRRATAARASRRATRVRASRRTTTARASPTRGRPTAARASPTRGRR